MSEPETPMTVWQLTRPNACTLHSPAALRKLSCSLHQSIEHLSCSGRDSSMVGPSFSWQQLSNKHSRSSILSVFT